MKKTVVLSVGGSIVAPDGLDEKFLREFTAFLKKESRYFRFIIVVGGGKVGRRYQETAKALGAGKREYLDWVGIASTRLNAELLRVVFGKQAEPHVVINPVVKPVFKKNILVAAGFQPGWSTDYVSVLLAKHARAQRVINLFDVDYVFDRDPKKFKDAKRIERISWRDFQKLVGTKWKPGVHAPFDPVATKTARALGLEVDVVNGRNIKNLKNVIESKPFVGTKIS